jgi:hypothetical protein
MEDIKLFFNWLDAKGIYCEYVYEWEIDHDLDFSYSFKNWIRDEEISIPSLIIAAFTWSDTEEGQDFWEDYHYQWQCYYKNQGAYPNISIY